MSSLIRPCGLSPDLHVQQLQHSWVVKGENPLHHQHVGGVNGGGLVHPSVFLKRVNRDLGSFSVIIISLGGQREGRLRRVVRPTQP